MAKLKAPLMAGFNAGKNYFAKNVRIADIVIDPEISKIFQVNEKLVEEIYQKILSFGYDESQPVVLQKGTMTILDGHTRLAAAKKAGLEEIPVVEKEFEDREEAILYTYERQALRRNLTGAEVIMVAQMLIAQGRKKRDNTGRAAEQFAERINVGASLIYHAQAIIKSGNEEVIEAVKNGEMSITEGYKTRTKTKTSKPEPETKFTVTDARGLPDNVKFLKSAVILLVESDQPSSAELLINHFLKKKERAGFMKLLPDSIRERLGKDENNESLQLLDELDMLSKNSI